MILSKVIKKAAAGRLEQMPPEAPKNNMQVAITIAEIMHSFAKKLGTWNLFDLPSAIFHAITDKDKKTVASECHERSDCVELKAPEVLKELYEVKKLLTMAMLFSKKRFRAVLYAAGFAKEDILLRKKTARILKPAFTVVGDKESKCVFVFIRGTRSIKDTLTDAVIDPIPFDHKFISSDDGNNKLRRNNNTVVSGLAHRGMFTAARWIRRHCTTVLLDALRENPDFKIKVVGHSLGGGTAALLTFMLREMKQFSSCTCVTFGPAACMTMELAEFGKPFITSIINGYDIVPTLSTSSVHDFICKGQKKDKNILTAVESGLSFAKAITGHAVTCCSQVVMTHQQRILTQSENIDTSNDLVKASQSSETNCESLLMTMSDDDDDEDDDDYDDEEETACPVPTSVKLDRHPLYPPGKIMHIVPVSLSENNNSNRKCIGEKRVCLYETPTQFYGKLRFARGVILDHLTNKYLKKLDQLINQLEKQQSKYGG